MSEFRKIHIFQRKDYVSDFAAQLWLEIASKAIHDKGNFTVALSGGSAPIEFYKKLSRDEEQLPWSKTHIFLVDERFVPFNDKDSNYGAIKENLLDLVGMDRENVHFIPEWEKSAELSAEKYEKIIKDFFKLKEEDFPRFDLIMLGVGRDGHIASLFPGTLALSESKRIIAGVRGSGIKYERISITTPVINNARNIVFLMTGAKKASIAERVLKAKDAELPATMITPRDGRVFFLLDKDAGADIMG